MTTSKLQIVNLALNKVGSPMIMALEDDTKEANVMRVLYPRYLNVELSKYRWTFAINRQVLPRLKDTPIFGYQYAYALPDDFLALVQIGEKDIIADSPKYQIEGKRILTNIAPPLRIRYTQRKENPNEFSELFIEALACKLAVESCDSLSQSNTKKAALIEDYERAVREAQRQNAIEKAPDKITFHGWNEIRES